MAAALPTSRQIKNTIRGSLPWIVLHVPVGWLPPPGETSPDGRGTVPIAVTASRSLQIVANLDVFGYHLTTPTPASELTALYRAPAISFEVKK